jgi:phosphate transport system substrate-binding protein
LGFLVVLLVISSLLLAACGSAQPTATSLPQPPQAPTAEPTAKPVEPTATTKPATASAAEVKLPEVNPLEVQGDIISAGSSTVFPLSERMAERFKDEGYKGNITIDSIGSGAGFERFYKAGETDISNASRKIKGSEVESCRAIGREPIEFQVGLL